MAYLVTTFVVSQRRACEAVTVRGSVVRYQLRQPEGLSGILCAGPVDIYWPTKRSPKMTANWTRASFHSRGARFQSAAA